MAAVASPGETRRATSGVCSMRCLLKNVKIPGMQSSPGT